MWELRDGLHPEWWLLPTPEDLTLPHTDSIKSAAFDATFYVHKVVSSIISMTTGGIIASLHHNVHKLLYLMCICTCEITYGA